MLVVSVARVIGSVPFTLGCLELMVLYRLLPRNRLKVNGTVPFTLE